MGYDDLTEGILEAARAEFAERGFADASVRSIATRAGVTTGAIYARFDKDSLFSALVGDAADALFELYAGAHRAFFEQSADEQYARLHESSNKALPMMLDIVYADFEDYYLLICKSEGSSLQDFVERLIDIETMSTVRFVANVVAAGLRIAKVDERLCHILSSAMINGFFETVKHRMTKSEAEAYVEKLSSFFDAGWDVLLDIKI